MLGRDKEAWWYGKVMVGREEEGYGGTGRLGVTGRQCWSHEPGRLWWKEKERIRWEGALRL